jgi:hypothetical protein
MSEKKWNSPPIRIASPTEIVINEESEIMRINNYAFNPTPQNDERIQRARDKMKKGQTHEIKGEDTNERKIKTY